MKCARNVVLLGFMGTGKTAVGRRVAARLGLEFVDLDALVEEEAGCTVAQIFEHEGEAGFRLRERRMAAAVSARSGLVVATGGGVVLDPENLRALAATGTLVCLAAEPGTILRRVADDAGRPLLRSTEPLARIRRLLEERRDRYAAIPLQVATDALTADEAAEAVLRLLATLEDGGEAGERLDRDRPVRLNSAVSVGGAGARRQRRGQRGRGGGMPGGGGDG